MRTHVQCISVTSLHRIVPTYRHNERMDEFTDCALISSVPKRSAHGKHRIRTLSHLLICGYRL